MEEQVTKKTKTEQVLVDTEGTNVPLHVLIAKPFEFMFQVVVNFIKGLFHSE